MSDLIIQKFKFILFQKEKPEYIFNDIFIHCSTKEELQKIFATNTSSRLALVCDNDTLLDITSLLLTYSNIDMLYISTNKKDIMWPYELETRNFPWVKITNQKQLKRHLYLKAMLMYFEQGEQHKTNGNWGLANLCFLDAKDAFSQAELYI